MRIGQLKDLYRYCGDPSALCGVRDVVCNDGTARGVRCFEMNNGRGLNVTVAPDRGMGIPYASYKGVNFGLLGKVGLRSPYLYTEDGARGFLRQFHGGLLTTGGINYAGAADVEDGVMLGLHGCADNTIADHAYCKTEVQGDELVLTACGELHESQIFGVNLSLYRTIKVFTESDVILIEDKVANHGYATSEMMLIYHINFGYPLLAPGAKVYSDAATIEPRTPFAAEGLDKYNLIEEPGIGREEQCYLHEGFTGGDNFAMLHNEALGIAAIVCFDGNRLPHLCQWKAMCAGDYALGLEPTTSGVLSRNDARANGIVCHLEPGEERAYSVAIRLTDCDEIIDSYKRRSR